MTSIIAVHRKTLEFYRCERKKGCYVLYSGRGLRSHTVTRKAFKHNYVKLEVE